MKKHGFTLAEILITLGIIGVVAALTTPALIQNVGNAKVGPKLQKAVSTFEVASESLMVNNQFGSLSQAVSNLTPKSPHLGRALSAYMKITDLGAPSTADVFYSRYDNGSTVYGSHNIGRIYSSDDGVRYYINLTGDVAAVNTEYADIPNNQQLGEVYIDINGIDKPNVVGKDLFKFALYNDGTLRPWGGKGFLRSVPPSDLSGHLWDGSSNTCNKTTVKGIGESCTGSIFDNGMKMIYQ